jgi:hypothetical protein
LFMPCYAVQKGKKYDRKKPFWHPHLRQQYRFPIGGRIAKPL